MRILHFADLHMDAPFRSLGPQVGSTLRQGLKKTLERICDAAVEHGVDALTCGGDLYEDKFLTPDTVAFVQRCFSRIAPIKVFLAPGNHDWLGPASLYNRAGFSPNVSVFSEARLEAVTLEEGLTLWGAAHQKPAGTQGFLSGFEGARAGRNLALFHGSEQGDFSFQENGKEAHAPFRSADVVRCGLDHALVGHFHRPRYAEFYTYPGNPSSLSFGEDGQRGAVLIDVADDGSVERRHLEVGGLPFIDAKVDLTGASDFREILSRAEEALGGLEGLVRLDVSGELAAEVDFAPSEIRALGSHMKGILAVVLRVDNVRPGYDLESAKDDRSVRGSFVRAVLARGDLDELQRRRVLTIGLRALDGHRDLEVP